MKSKDFEDVCLLGVDPGPASTGYCELRAGCIGRHGWIPNAQARNMLYLDDKRTHDYRVVIESPQAQDRPLGPDLRNTIFWAGRLLEAAIANGRDVREVEERDVSLWLTGNGGTNVGVKIALKNQFGDTRHESCAECQATGQVPGVRGPKKCPRCSGARQIRVPSPLAGFTEHELSALAAALYASQQPAKLSPL